MLLFKTGLTGILTLFMNSYPESESGLELRFLLPVEPVISSFFFLEPFSIVRWDSSCILITHQLCVELSSSDPPVDTLIETCLTHGPQATSGPGQL